MLGTPPAFVLSQDQTLTFNPLSSIGFTDQAQLIRNYCLLFALFLFCIVFKVQSPLLRCPARVSLCILSFFPRIVTTFFELFSAFLRSFSISERFSRLVSFWFDHSRTISSYAPFVCEDQIVLCVRNRDSYVDRVFRIA